MIHEADGGFVLAPLLATDRIYKPWCLHISIPLEGTTSFAPCFVIYCLCDLNNVLTPLFSYLYLTASSVRYKDSLCHVTEEVTVSEDSNISLALFSFTVI